MSAACSREDAPVAALDAGGDTAAAPPALASSRIPPDFQCDPTLESIRAGIFTTSCAFDYCHGTVANVYQLWLTADVQTVSKELVGGAALSCKGWTRVVPGDLEHSLLWNKVTEASPACGVQMPYGYEPLPQPALDCIRGWIQSL